MLNRIHADPDPSLEPVNNTSQNISWTWSLFYNPDSIDFLFPNQDLYVEFSLRKQPRIRKSMGS